MTVAILMPTHDRADTVGEAIASCLRQTDEDWELYIWDDGSAVATREAISPYADRRLYYRWAPKAAANESAVRNNLLAWWSIHCPYACWLDSDDVMHPDRVAVQRHYLDAHLDVDVCLAPLGIFRPDELRDVREGLFMESYLKADPSRYDATLASYRGNLCTPTAMFRPSVRAVPFDERMIYGGCDLLWTFTLVQRGFRFGAVDRQLYYLREHPGRLTRQREQMPRAMFQPDLDHFYAEVARMGGIQ